MRRTSLAALASILVGCGGSVATSDGGTDAGVLDGWSITPPEAPAIDWLAAGTPEIAPPAAPAWACPSGWHEVVGADGDPSCEAWPESGAPTCDASSMAIPGASCALVGSECAADGWPAALPATGVRYVRVGASGDGTRASPYGTLVQALVGVTPGTTIALAVGEHAGAVALPTGVTLVGACASGTTLRAPTADEAAGVLDVMGTDVVVRDVALTGPRPGVTVSGAGRALTLDRVIIHDVVRDGVLVVGASSVTASDLLVRDVASAPSTGRGGRALDVQEGGQVDVTRLEARRVHNAGVVAWDPSTSVELTDAWIHDVAGDHDTGPYGYGIDAEPGAALTARRVVVEHVHANGLTSQGEGASLVAYDVIVRDVAPNADGTLGGGAATNGGARLEIHGGSIDRTTQHGVSASDVGTTAVLEDVVVRDVGPRVTDGHYGTGIEVDSQAQLTASRLVVRRASGAALFAGRGASLVGTDVTVDDTRTNSQDGFAPSVHVIAASAQLERASLTHSIGLGVFGTDEPTIELTDVVVDFVATLLLDPDEIGMGVYADGGTLTMTRVRVHAAHDGVAIRAAEVHLADVAIVELAQETAAEAGGGLVLALGARGTVERILVADAAGWGGLVFGSGTDVTLRDLVIRDVRIHPTMGTSYSLAFATESRADVARAVIETAQSEAFVVSLANVLATDLRISQSGTGEPSELYAPSAIAVKLGRLAAERVEIETSHGLGVRVEGNLGSTPTSFADLVIREVAARDCGMDCPMGAGGNAFTAAPGSDVVLDRFDIRSAALCGLQIFSPEVTATRGRIAQSTIGVNLQLTGFDPSRLAGVLLEDNLVDVDARELPIPGTSPPPEEPPAPAPADPTAG